VVGQFTLRSVNSVCSKEEFPDEWKKLIVVPVYKKGDKTDCSNY
jgi:predicted sugar kinase